MTSVLDYVRENTLEVAIWAIVLFTFAWVTFFSKTPPKVTMAIGLTVFVIAGTLAFLQFREVYRAAHPNV